jgi:cold-inducible RNA-binding protein
LNIYVGNLSFNTTERELEEAFASYGEVQSARIAMDRDTNRPRGFGFVEMANQAEAEAAIAGLNGQELQGRTLTVNEARPREDRGGSRGGGGGGGGYGNRGGGYSGGGGRGRY